MRRVEIVESFVQLSQALTESNLEQELSQWVGERRREEEGKILPPTILAALKKYTLAAKDFTPTTNQLANIIGLDSLTDTGVWLRIIADDSILSGYG